MLSIRLIASVSLAWGHKRSFERLMELRELEVQLSDASLEARNAEDANFTGANAIRLAPRLEQAQQTRQQFSMETQQHQTRAAEAHPDSLAAPYASTDDAAPRDAPPRTMCHRRLHAT